MTLVRNYWNEVSNAEIASVISNIRTKARMWKLYTAEESLSEWGSEPLDCRSMLTVPLPKFIKRADLTLVKQGISRQTLEQAMDYVHKVIKLGLLDKNHEGYIFVVIYCQDRQFALPLESMRKGSSKFAVSWSAKNPCVSIRPAWCLGGLPDKWRQIKDWFEVIGGKIHNEAIGADEGEATVVLDGLPENQWKLENRILGDSATYYTKSNEVGGHYLMKFAEWLLAKPDRDTSRDSIEVSMVSSPYEYHNQRDFLIAARAAVPTGWDNYTIGMLYGLGGIEDLPFARVLLEAGGKKAVEVNLGYFEHPADFDKHEDYTVRGELIAIVKPDGYALAVDLASGPLPKVLLDLFPGEPEELLPGEIPGIKKGKTLKKKAPKKKVAKKKRTK